MPSELNVFVVKLPDGYIGYVRIAGGRVLRYTDVLPTENEAANKAEEIKNILIKHPMWWNL